MSEWHLTEAEKEEWFSLFCDLKRHEPDAPGRLYDILKDQVGTYEGTVSNSLRNKDLIQPYNGQIEGKLREVFQGGVYTHSSPEEREDLQQQVTSLLCWARKPEDCFVEASCNSLEDLMKRTQNGVYMARPLQKLLVVALYNSSPEIRERYQQAKQNTRQKALDSIYEFNKFQLEEPETGDYFEQEKTDEDTRYLVRTA